MVKKILFWSLGLLAVIFVGGYLLLFPPLPKPPEIARNLPSNFAEADAEFGRRVAVEYALPLSVNSLVARLEEQGFVVETSINYAIFKKSGFPCSLFWRIHWEAKDGSVSELKSKYGGVCV